MMKKVLVAGSTGYIGRYVVQEFKNRGYWVRALVRSIEKATKPSAYLEPAIADLADELVVAEATKPETLASVCDGIDIVFSSLGMTHPDFVHSSFDVDHQANLNILRKAENAKVQKFIYISVFNAQKMLEIENIQAHEKFVGELHASILEYTVVRPIGYFSDMAQFLNMASNGFMVSLGEGDCKLNPIHGVDLSKVCVDAAEGNKSNIEVGGPEVLTYCEIAKMAADVVKRRPLTISLPIWIADGITAVTGLINRDIHDIALFASTVSKNDMIAPQYGTHKLRAFFEEMAAKGH